MNVIIVGCGRVGVELALSIHQNHLVTIIDPNAHAFDRLGLHFSGRTVQGEGMDLAVLQRAGIESAQALAAVTSSDNVNVIVARVARDLYNIQRVVARLYNPRKLPIYEQLDLQTVSSSSWGAHRIEQILIHPGLQSMYSAGNGEVQVYEVSIPAEWAGHKLVELVPGEAAIPVTLSRGGCGMLPHSDTLLQAEDILHVSATSQGADTLRERLHVNGNGRRKAE